MTIRAAAKTKKGEFPKTGNPCTQRLDGCSVMVAPSQELKQCCEEWLGHVETSAVRQRDV
jgi:hypothetical protein